MRLGRILETARFEWRCAVRSRRALTIVALYLAASLLSMNGAISALGKIETQIAEIMQLPADESRGVISTALWKSKRFQKIVRSALDDTLVYDDIAGRHPAELIYAWLAFFYVPLLTVLVSGNRAADEKLHPFPPQNSPRSGAFLFWRITKKGSLRAGAVERTRD
jgi:hypothetical protein